MADASKKVLAGMTIAYVAAQSGLADPDKWGKLVSTKDFANGVAVVITTSSGPSVTPVGALVKEIQNTIQGDGFRMTLPVKATIEGSEK